MQNHERVAPNTSLNAEFCQPLQRGIMDLTYKGVSTLKCPFDLALYQEVIWELKPGTILEFGSYKGGSALWLADLLTAYDLKTRLITLDIAYMHEFRDPRFEFRLCNVEDIPASLDDEFVASLPRPLLVIEDSSHMGPHVFNVMEFFHRHSAAGDYLIIEDGIVSVIMDEKKFQGGPFQAIHAFLDAHPDDYEIDRARCDRFGRNVTWNLDGYIRRK